MIKLLTPAVPTRRTAIKGKPLSLAPLASVWDLPREVLLEAEVEREMRLPGQRFGWSWLPSWTEHRLVVEFNAAGWWTRLPLVSRSAVKVQSIFVKRGLMPLELVLSRFTPAGDAHNLRPTYDQVIPPVAVAGRKLWGKLAEADRPVLSMLLKESGKVWYVYAREKEYAILLGELLEQLPWGCDWDVQ